MHVLVLFFESGSMGAWEEVGAWETVSITTMSTCCFSMFHVCISTAARSGISTGWKGPVVPVPEPVLPIRD